MRKVDETSPLIGQKLPLPDKIDDKGHFIIVRGNDIYEYRLVPTFEYNDVIVAFTKESDFEVVSKWLQQNP